MDFGPAGFIHPTGAFIWGLLNIIIINLVLSGDNAVLIAMAVRSLPPGMRQKGFIFGAGAAVVLRIVLEQQPSKLSRLKKRSAFVGDPDDIIGMDWSSEWTELK